MQKFQKLDDYANHVHELNQKWWVNIDTGEPVQRNVYEMLQLMLSEIAEAMEGERKSLPDDKLPHRPMAEVEMADLVIRVLDFAGGFGYPLVDYLEIPFVRTGNPKNKGERLYKLSKLVMRVGKSLETNNPELKIGYDLTSVIRATEKYCIDFEYELWDAVQEKLEYNKNRPDHQLESRKKEGGKKW